MKNLVIGQDKRGTPTWTRVFSEDTEMVNGVASAEYLITVPTGAQLCLYKSTVDFIVGNETIALPGSGSTVTAEFGLNPASSEVTPAATLFVTPLANGYISCEFYRILG